MYSTKRYIVRFLQAGFPEKKMAMLVFLNLVRTYFNLKTRSFSSLVLQYNQRKNHNLQGVRMQPLGRITGLHRKMSRLLFGSGSCLVESLALKRYLSKHNLHMPVVLGIKKEGGRLVAHAWIEGLYKENNDFTPIMNI